MHIAIYIRSIKTAQGTERVTANIARGLAHAGCRVDFLLEVREGWLVDELEKDPDINVICMREQGTSGLLHRLFQIWVVIRNNIIFRMVSGANEEKCPVRLLRVMLRENPSLLSLFRYIRRAKPVSVISFLNYENLALLLVKPFIGGETRCVVSVRNHISTSAMHGESKWMRNVPCVMKRYFSRADLIVAPSHGVADDVRMITGLAAGKFRVIHNPVYREELRELSKHDPMHPWFSDDDIPVIVAAGKFKPQKDFNTLIRAFAQIRRKRHVRLVIFGVGPLADELMRLSEELDISDDFQMPGHVRNPYAYFSRASVFVLSSAWEGLPNVLIEAMACGCPVVSTDCPSGPAEILENGKFGKLVPVGDYRKLAQAVVEVLDSPPDPKPILKRAMHFSLENAVDGYKSALCLQEKTG